MVKRGIVKTIARSTVSRLLDDSAQRGKANLIVSRDLDLLRLKRYDETGFMSPIDFLHTLEGFKKAAWKFNLKERQMIPKPQSYNHRNWTIYSINIHGIFFERWCREAISDTKGWS